MSWSLVEGIQASVGGWGWGIQTKDEGEAVEARVRRNAVQTKACLWPQPLLRSSPAGGVEACERIASLGLLEWPPSPQRVRATVAGEFEIRAMLMEVSITETGFTAPKIDPELFSLIQN